jgi:DNA polymerase I-like protein with 3'-5' exonuclease and polymerase domains
MLRYAASDVLDTAALAQVLPTPPEAILSRERLAEAMTARVAHRGLRIDAERVAELTAEHTRLQAEAGARVRAFGPENPGSGLQIAQALAQLGETLPVSEKGNPSVAEHVLSIIKRSRSDTPAGQLATAVLDYRHSTTVLGLFLAPYAALCERADGRMRPTVYTLGTDTGRMSAVRPNIQQLPREGGVRSVVTADPGYVLISADFSGVELRGAAALSQDPTMMHMIAEEDAGRFDGFHWAVARQAFGPGATKSDRYVAKRGVFGKIYGGGVATLAKQVGVTEHEMGAIVASLDTLTPGLSQWSEQIRFNVRRGQTQFPSYSGRIIHFPVAYPHKAPNYAIQGSCRELLVDALVRWRDTRWGDCTLIPVHDELIVMVPEEDAQAATTELVRCMAGELYGVQIVADPSEPSFVWQDST